ncbi:acyl-CoA dehydrogenase family protein [Actinoplanes sp. NPDC026670]|uniref:acyl-CoA dehydrogenase family protein n=1 Tax=Actinoplanes sp. NPDC026670 TaxID=3154700 RepID=UPI0033CFADC7
MDFELSTEAVELAGLTRDLAASGRPLWPALAEAGILAAALPKRAGGEGYGLVEQCAILIELGRHAADVPYLTSIVVAASTIAEFGADEQVETLAVPAGRGDLILSGTDVAPAVARQKLVLGTAAQQLGVVERALEMTAEYARTRVQFERPIGAFQAVSQRLADAWIDVEALRLAVWQAASRPEAAEIATAGFWAAEAGHRVLHTAVHVHGGVGIDMDYPLHRYFLAAEHHEFLLGGATAQLLDLAEVLR